MRKRGWLLTSLLLLLTLTLAACGGAKAPAPEAQASSASGGDASAAPASQPANQAPATIATTLANGGVGSLVFLPATLASYGGFFEAEGLEVDHKSFEGGAAAATALIGGQVDFAAVALDQVVKAQAKGQDLVALALFTRYPAISLIVDAKYKDEIKSIEDLKGKPVGISSKGSGSHLALIAMLEKHGMTEDDVRVVAAGVSTLPAAMANGQIVAGVISDPFVTSLVQEGTAFILEGTDLTTEADTLALYGSDYPFIGLVTRLDVIEKEPEKVQRMVNAVVKTQQFIASGSAAEIAAKMPEEFKKPSVEIYEAALEHTREAYSPDGMLNQAGVETVVKTLAANGQVDASQVTVEKLYDLTFLNQAP